MNLINFESKKIWATKKVRFLVLLSLFLLVIFFFYCLPKEQADQQALIDSSSLAHSQKHPNLTLKDWHELLLEENHQLADYTQKLPALAQAGLIENDTAPGYTYYKIKRNNYLIQHRMVPISERFGTTGAAFSQLVLTLLASGFGLFLILLIVGDCLTTNFETNSIQLTFSQPISRSRYFLSLYLLTWFNAILFSLLLLICAFLLGSLIQGPGSFNYPVLISSNQDVAIIPLWQFLGLLFILWVFVLSFVLALHFLLSLIVKKSSIALIGTLWLLLIGGIFSSQRLPFFMSTAHYNPFSYLNVAKVFNSNDWQVPSLLTLKDGQLSAYFSVVNNAYYGNLSLSRYLQNPQMGLLTGITCLVISTLSLLGIAILIFKRNISLT